MARPPSMRRLPPVNKKILFSAGPLGSQHRHGYTILSHPTFSCDRETLGTPATRSARLFRLTSIRTRTFVESSSARFQLESVVRALPSLSRSQSADSLELSPNRIEAVAQSPGRGGKTRVLWQRCYQGVPSGHFRCFHPRNTLLTPTGRALDQLAQLTAWQLVRLRALRQRNHAYLTSLS